MGTGAFCSIGHGIFRRKERWKCAVKKGIIKVLVLFAVFCLGVIGFGQLTNHSNRDLTTEMADATLPIVS